MQTYTELLFGLYDTTAEKDAIFKSVSSENFCNLQTIAKKQIIEPKYGTLEHNQFKLDGSFSQPENSLAGKIQGLWSNILSNSKGEFLKPLSLTVDFSTLHSSVGLTFDFHQDTEDFASEIRVSWYDEKGGKLSVRNFLLKETFYVASEQVIGYQKIVIEFLKTNKPYRRAKLKEIQFGAEKLFSKQEIVSASILEEVDTLTNELRINTLDIKLFSKDAEFSILNPKGVFASLQAQQKMQVFEYLDEEKLEMGTFYLDEWSAESDNISIFKAVSAIGLLEKKQHLGGIYDTTVESLVKEILQETKYELEESLKDIKIAGFLPIGTRRSALQQLAFAICAVVDSSRSDVLKIYRLRDRPSSYISYSRKYLKETVKLKQIVTGVRVSSFTYSRSIEEKEILNDILAQGEHFIAFNEPMHSIAISGGEILQSNCNYTKILVNKTGAITLSGKTYAKTNYVTPVSMPEVPANAEENILLVENATLVSPSFAQSVANNIIKYCMNRHEYSFKMRLGEEVLTDYAIIQSFNNNKFKGRIQSFEIDLTGGFRVEVVAVGTPLEDGRKDFTGEFFAGEGGMV